MSAILRGVLSRQVPVLRQNLSQRATVVSGPPRVRVSLAEKVGLGVAMMAAIIAPGGYVISQVLVYRSRPGTEDS